MPGLILISSSFTTHGFLYFPIALRLDCSPDRQRSSSRRHRPRLRWCAHGGAFHSQIPVISAVGHEPDVTISDYVADRRASTPSNAAEIAVPDIREIREQLASYKIRASQAMRKKLALLRNRLEKQENRRVLTIPTSQFENRRLELDRLRDRLLTSEEHKISRYREKFFSLAASLDAMSPVRVLGRGYIITADEEGNYIKSAAELTVGQKIRLIYRDGNADCLVEDIKRSR